MTSRAGIAGLFLAAWAFFGLPSGGLALEPHEILVLANRNAAKSVGLAKHYLQRRGVPEKNLLVLWVTDKEWCSREDYEKKIKGPVRKFREEKDPDKRIRCILIMSGLPLKVAPPEMTKDEKSEVEKLKKKRAELTQQSGGLEGEERKKAGKDIEEIDARIRKLERRDEAASLDSEIALVLKDGYDLPGWIPNPFFVGTRGKAEVREDVLIVSRLDGPSEAVVKRVIEDSIAAEESGLKGTAYFDARWPRPAEDAKTEPGFGYAFYDRSIHKAAELVRKSGKMPVVVNEKQELFGPGECPDAALYCGWYSLAKYVDAFQWRPGAVGYHIASSECVTLKNPQSQLWCKRMLEEGIASTLGPVNEPYVQAFPVPEVFFKLLLDGYYTLAECYALSQPFWSWQMVLVGDPLYRPFRNVSGSPQQE